MEYNALVKKAKLRFLRMHYESKVGHIGGGLSALDAMLFLHVKAMQKEDTFVLSKGHAAGALYITMWVIGHLPEEELERFHKDDSKLAGHPSAGWSSYIPFSTGSLGHGLPLSAGLAFAKKLKDEVSIVYCLLSDGEWEEGSNWEALIFVAHHRLNNLVLLIDANNLQGFGDTTEIASLEPLSDKIRSFGVNVQEIDGHDPKALEAALKVESTMPKVIILRTIKGKGVSYMEGRMEWHYLPMNEAQYRQAVDEINAA